MKKLIYLDNAATSFPKVPGVREAVSDFMDNIGASAGRSAYSLSITSSRILYQSRKLLSNLIGLKDSKRVIFTLNATMAINTILQGFLKQNDVVVTTQMEHNAIKRPLNALKDKLNLEIREIPCSPLCEVDLNVAKDMLKGAKLLACVHINNVVGAITPLESLSQIARQNNVKILLDATQSMGCVDMSDVMSKVDFIAFSGHKGLLSPMGVGGFAMASNFDVESLNPLVFGGTGSRSEEEIHPEFLPDKFESGTMNLHGIVGLKASLEWISKKGINEIEKHKSNLRENLIYGISGENNIKIYQVRGKSRGALSFDIINQSLSNVAIRLERDFGICVRVGLHCSPATHKVIGSFAKGGSIRISSGVFNTKDEIEYTIYALKEIARK